MGTSRESGGGARRAAGGGATVAENRTRALTSAEARELRSRGIPARAGQITSTRYNLNAPAPQAGGIRTRRGANRANRSGR